MSGCLGFLSFVLHAHLPYVRHPEYDDFLEEDWLLEAILESYVPMIGAVERLRADSVPVRFTLSVTPTLSEMLTDTMLMERYANRLKRYLRLADYEIGRTRHKDLTIVHQTALLYKERIKTALDWVQRKPDEGILAKWKEWNDEGVVECITSGATHGYLPLMKTDASRRAQLVTAKDNFRHHFGAEPRGVWLPECGYDWTLEEVLEQADLRFFFLDAHGLLNGMPRPRKGVYAPVSTAYDRVAFARDPKCAQQVWSRESGYPGDPEYREFYRDLGHDADYNYIQPFLHNDGIRRDTGFKYYRITGTNDLSRKEPYRPKLAKERAQQHAAHFVASRIQHARELQASMDRPANFVASYDAELFGHWWFEGPDFFEAVFREMATYSDCLKPLTPSEYIDEYPTLQSCQPISSSWGRNGFHEVWLNSKTDWIYRHLHECETRMIRLAEDYPDAEGLERRVLNQAMRELLLAQSSDWAFQMTMEGSAPYAERRTREHIDRFLRLHYQITHQRIHEQELNEFEARNPIFPHADYRVYQSSGINRPTTDQPALQR